MHGISARRRADLRDQLRDAVTNMNTCARLKDRDWNRVNYGAVTVLKGLLEDTGDKIDAPVLEDTEGYFHIPAVFINGQEAYSDPREQEPAGRDNGN